MNFFWTKDHLFLLPIFLVLSVMDLNFSPLQMRTKKIANELKVLTLANEYFHPFQRQCNIPYSKENPQGVLLGILGGGVPPGSPNPDPMSDQRMLLSTSVFSPGV